LLLILSIAESVMKDAGFVIGFNGAVMGSALVYVFLSLLFLSHTSNLQNLNKSLRLERWFCRFLVTFGTTAALLGGGVSLINAYFPKYCYDPLSNSLSTSLYASIVA
jgi:hypothetical protein